MPDGMPEMAGITEHRHAPAPPGRLPVRIYRPTSDSSAPVLVYLHGGGLVMGSNHSFEPLARALAAASGAVVVAVDYRLAPESPPPAQFDDACAATEWVSRSAAELGVDAGRLAVVGDSAGGSLAAAVALAARDRGGPAICAQVLLYPGLDRDMSAPSITLLADAPMLSHDDIEYLHALADGDAGPPRDPYLVPAYADRSVGPAAGDRRDRGLRPDPRLGRAVRGAAARRWRADHRHPLSRDVPRLSDAFGRDCPWSPGYRRDRRAAAGEVRSRRAIPSTKIPEGDS